MTGSPKSGTLQAALWGALALCAAAAFWIANGVAPWDGDRSNAWHQYEYLADGFLHGHTYLSVDPAPELLKLKDPYDPAANARYRMWDTSLYNGKFYLYQGPVPAVILMAPWRAVTGHVMPQRLAVAVFAAAGMIGLGLLLSGIRDRHFPRLSATALALIILVAFHVSWLPVVLRRPALWELPVVAAAACLWWALYFLWKFHDSGGRAAWAAATGTALALLIGSRAASLFGAGAVALLLFVPTLTQGGAPERRWRQALIAAAIASAGGLALLAYNKARFGSFLDFGLHYALFGEDYRGIRYSNIEFIPFNLWVYLFSAPQAGPYFPFLHPFWTDAKPGGFIGFEEMYGVGFMLPVHLAGIAALGWAWTHRGVAGARAVVLTLSASVLATVFAGLILFSWAWACSRFITELMAGWTVVTAVGLMVVFGSGAATGRLTKALIAVAASWSVACTWLASAEFRGFMKQTNPVLYAAAAHTLDYPSLWWAEEHEVAFGPVEVSVHVDPQGSQTTAILASGRPQNENQVEVAQAKDGTVRIRFTQNERLVLETKPLPARSGKLHLMLEAPWLYPPLEHPYWDSVRDPLLKSDLQTRFAAEWDGGSARVSSTHSADPVSFAPAVLGASSAAAGQPYVEDLRRTPAVP